LVNKLDMIKNTKKYLYIMGGILCAIFMHFYLQYSFEKRELQENVEYPLIYNQNSEIKGKIVKRSISKVIKNTYLIELTDNQKFTIYGFSFLQVGDSICKPANVDTLYIFRGNERYINRL